MIVGLALVVTVLITYTPAWSEALSPVQYMLDFQSCHNAEGS
jgi:hypothetical protein